MKTQDLKAALHNVQDETYREFMIRLVPNLPPDTILGVRTPELRRIARELKDREVFLNQLPHGCFEENQIHAFLLERERDFSKGLEQVEKFLMHVDNWATCDQLRPKTFGKNRQHLLPHISTWLASNHPYTVRFGIGMLMNHFLDTEFDSQYLDMVAAVRREDYYVKMMAAWYFATALAKQFDAVLPYISQGRLDPWVHRKTIQKAVESFRIPEEQKQILKSFRT